MSAIYIKQGTREYRNANIALFASGFVTFANLYNLQPLLPKLSEEFNITPATASLALSVSTFSLALFMLIAGSLSEVWGRRQVMIIGMGAASLLVVITAFSSSFEMLLVLRFILGIALACVPSIAMAYLGEEIEPNSLGVAMGIYISGNSLGALFGRLVSGLVASLTNWHVAILVTSALSVIAAIVFIKLLPPSRNFVPRKLQFSSLLYSLTGHLKDPVMLSLYCLGAILLGSNVALYNYIGFRLIEPPYSLNETVVSFIFILFLFGTISSVVTSRLSIRLGKGKTLVCAFVLMAIGAIMTLSTPLWLIIAGVSITTFGFFGAHTIASGWVGIRATHDRAQASSLYLFFYYGISGVTGTVGGVFWSSGGWTGVVTMLVSLCIVSLIIVFLLLQAVRRYPIEKPF